MSKENSKKENKSLSESEKKRLDRFNRIAEDMEQQGYTRQDLIINIGKANWFAVLLLIPLVAIGYGLYYLVNHRFDYDSFNLIFFIVAFIVLIVVHELIHGLFWSLYTPHHFKDVAFGVLKSSMTPYCTCLVPLEKKQYIIGTIMPLVLLGIVPMIAGAAIGNINLLIMGIMMADAAAGDILIIMKILGYKSSRNEITYMDHPTEAGVVVFER